MRGWVSAAADPPLMSRCAVIGSPIAHSRSPALHRAAYAALGLTDWTYEAVELGADQVAPWLAGLGPEWRGISVTMPAKNAALLAADGASDRARRLGAANTLVRAPGGWRADNTDVAGIAAALAELGTHSVRGASVVGAGGTAAAAIQALADLGAETVRLVVRTPQRAGAAVALAESLGMRARIESIANSARQDLDDPAPWWAEPVVISTVPASATAVLATLPWRAGQAVLDVTYHPHPTALCAAAAGRGARTGDGLAVLLWQAAAQVELMTGHSAPVDAMRRALDLDGTLSGS